MFVCMLFFCFRVCVCVCVCVLCVGCVVCVCCTICCHSIVVFCLCCVVRGVEFGVGVGYVFGRDGGVCVDVCVVYVVCVCFRFDC